MLVQWDVLVSRGHIKLDEQRSKGVKEGGHCSPDVGDVVDVELTLLVLRASML